MGAETESPSETVHLSRDELVRYSRHILLPQVGEEGQRELKRARVLLVGAGGLGSPAALYLAAAGVGTIGLVDFDVVDLSNLQRQILHGTGGIGRPKLDSARERLADINPNVRIESYATRLSSENALDIARGYDVILDGTDNFPTRYLINDASVLLGVPNVHGSVYRFEGQASIFAASDGPCYRCLFRQPPPPDLVPSCAEGGVLGVVPGLLGTIQATETIKLLLGLGDTLVGKLLLIDVLAMSFRTIRIRRDPECPACGTREIRELIDYEDFCAANGSHTEAAAARAVQVMAPSALAERIARGEELDIIDVREPYEWQIGHIPGARLVPLATIADEIPRLNHNRTVVLYCKVGARSMRAAEQLVSAGLPQVHNLAGGIIRWIDEVDPSMARY